MILSEPQTEAGRTLRGKMCWAFHAFSATEHNPDCEVARKGILAIEREAADANAAGRWRRGLERLANLVLDRPFADPDDDVAKEARAAIKRLASTKPTDD